MLGIARSLAIYYGRPFRLAKLVKFYRRLLPENGLYFDIGAHVGHRVWAARKAGVRAVAVEPQPACLSVLNWQFGRDGKVVIVPSPVADQVRPISLQISRRHPTVASTNHQWVDNVSHTAGFRHVRWTESLALTATTLDALIEKHGRPDYCKIDIEGGEAAALAGLSKPIGLISVERLPEALSDFDQCMAALASLGEYRFNWCRGERPEFASASWLTGDALQRALEQEQGVCDVFAGLPKAIARLGKNTGK